MTVSPATRGLAVAHAALTEVGHDDLCRYVSVIRFGDHPAMLAVVSGGGFRRARLSDDDAAIAGRAMSLGVAAMHAYGADGG
jgi:hypothetical protein